MLRRWFRIAYVPLIWLFSAGVLAQVFLAGLALFVGPGSWALHANLGYILHLTPLLIAAAALIGGLRRDTLFLVAALFVVTAVQPLLPLLRTDLPVAAALHPVLALLIFALASVLAVRAVSDARAGPVAADQTSPAQGTSGLT